MRQGGYGMSPDFQRLVPLTPAAKVIIIICGAFWLIGTVILEQYVFHEQKLTWYLGLIPYQVVTEFFVWQPFTYMFMHAANPLHIIFNMLLLWWLGSDLEARWGTRFFVTYYLICGLGAAVLYIAGAGIYTLVTGKVGPMVIPVVGASGAVFGLMVAYALYFGERVIYFMMLFPMKAKVFVILLGVIEVVIVLNNGVGGSGAANLAHIGGLVTGFLFLKILPRLRGPRGGSRGQDKKRKNPGLKLVVNNSDLEKPRYWN